MTTLHAQTQQHLRRIVEQIERLEDEKKALTDDIKDKYAEAKSTGFDAKALRKIISMRKQDTDTRTQEQAIIDVYMHALGMTPMEKVWSEAAE